MNESIMFKLSKADKQFLQKEADKMRLPLSTYVRLKMTTKYEV